MIYNYYYFNNSIFFYSMCVDCERVIRNMMNKGLDSLPILLANAE